MNEYCRAQSLRPFLAVNPKDLRSHTVNGISPDLSWRDARTITWARAGIGDLGDSAAFALAWLAFLISLALVMIRNDNLRAVAQTHYHLVVTCYL